MQRLLKAIGLSKSGKPYEGPVCRWNEDDPRISVAVYGVDKNGMPDPKCRLTGNRVDGWVRV